jgi:hypothetical protein
MSSTPFRFVQRRTLTSGKVPTLSTLLTGEIYLQAADGTIYFRDAYENKLHTVITDASGFGLNKIKFTGAVSGDVPLWDGGKFIPQSTGNFGTNSTNNSANLLNTGYGSNSILQVSSNNNSSGIYSTTLGSGNIAEEDFSYAFGKQAKSSQFGQFSFANGSFNEVGDSQYSFVMGRAVTNSSTPTKILINNSDKIVEFDLGSTIFFTANVVGVGDDKYISNEIRGIAKRSSANGSDVVFLNTPSKSIYALSPSNSNFSVNVIVSTSDNSLKIECVGDSSGEMVWFAKVDLIQIKSKAVKNLYFKPTQNVNWFSTQNWFSDSSFNNNVNYIPDENSIAYMYGATGAYVDIGDQLWKTPTKINTLNVTDISGICIYSNNSKAFNGTIIGNSTFLGAAYPDYLIKLNTLSPTEISNLSLNSIRSLTAGQIASLSLSLISSLTAAQLSAMNSTQLYAFTDQQLNQFTIQQMRDLFEYNIPGFQVPISNSIPGQSPSSLFIPPSSIPNLILYSLNKNSSSYLTFPPPTARA